MHNASQWQLAISILVSAVVLAGCATTTDTLQHESARSIGDVPPETVKIKNANRSVTSSADFNKSLVAYKAGDYAVALAEWQPLAEHGVTDAQYNLGNLYYSGKGVAKDYTEAMRWYRAAADRGDAWAQYNIGGMYESGMGVPQNFEEAVVWYRKAADKGDTDAVYNLGAMYEDGRGVPQDLNESVKWFEKAAALGNLDAKANAERVKQNLK